MRKRFFIILLSIISIQFIYCQLLIARVDTEINISDKIVYEPDNYNLENNSILSNLLDEDGMGKDSIAPELKFDISSVGDSFLIVITSNENLYNGWLQDKLLHIFYSWHSYGLYTRLVCDSKDEIHSTVSNSGGGYYYIRMNNKGEISEEIPAWNGVQSHPILTDSNGHVVYINQPTPSGNDGVVDQQNNSHIVRTDMEKIKYTKIDSSGNILINDITIVINANSWTGCARITCNNNGTIYVIWSNGEHEICYIVSVDGGNTWSTTNSFGSVTWMQWHPEIVTDDSNNIHIIWMDTRITGGYDYELFYKKLYPNGAISIDDTRLTDNTVIGAIMFPKFCMDSENNIYVTWSDYYGSGPNWFTKINGNIDKGGASAINAEITLIEDTIIPQNNNMECPVPIVDSWDNLHLIANAGYQPNTNKYLYYQKYAVSPVVFVTFPDSTKRKIEMIGSDTLWSGYFSPSLGGDYYLEASGSDTAGNIGYVDTLIYYSGIEENKNRNSNNIYNITVKMLDGLSIDYNISETKVVSISIYNIIGQKVYSNKGIKSPGQYSVKWNGNTGVYFIKIDIDRYKYTKKIVIIK